MRFLSIRNVIYGEITLKVFNCKSTKLVDRHQVVCLKSVKKRQGSDVAKSVLYLYNRPHRQGR
jgi:hypothetical protein